MRARCRIGNLALGQDAGSDLDVLLHGLVLIFRQLTPLQQHRVGHAHLADVVKRRRAPDQLDVVFAEAQLAGNPRSGTTDTLGVLIRVVVPVLGRDREPLQDLESRRFERIGASRIVCSNCSLCFRRASSASFWARDVASRA